MRTSDWRVVGCGATPSTSLTNVKEWARASADSRVARRLLKLLHGGRRAGAQAHDAAGKGKEVLHPMAHFSQQQLLSFARPLELGYVAGDFGRADNLPARVPDWRNGERNVDLAAVLALPDSLKVMNSFAAINLLGGSRALLPVGRAG